MGCGTPCGDAAGALVTPRLSGLARLASAAAASEKAGREGRDEGDLLPVALGVRRRAARGIELEALDHLCATGCVLDAA